MTVKRKNAPKSVVCSLLCNFWKFLLAPENVSSWSAGDESISLRLLFLRFSPSWYNHWRILPCQPLLFFLQKRKPETIFDSSLSPQVFFPILSKFQILSLSSSSSLLARYSHLLLGCYDRLHWRFIASHFGIMWPFMECMSSSRFLLHINQILWLLRNSIAPSQFQRSLYT